MNQSRRISVKALCTAFKKEGAQGVKDLMLLKPKSGPVLLKAMEELRSAGNDVAELQAFYDEKYIVEEKEYVTSYDREIYGDRDEIASRVDDLTPAKVYQIIRKFEIKPALHKRAPGTRGKPTNVYLFSEVLDAINRFNQEKSDEYLTEKPAGTVTIADIQTMLPEEWELNSPHYCSAFLKFFGINKSEVKYRTGDKGKGSNLYDKRSVEVAVEIMRAGRKQLASQTETCQAADDDLDAGVDDE